MARTRRLLALLLTFLLALGLVAIPARQAMAGSYDDALRQSDLFNNVVSPMANYNADQLGPYNTFFANHQEVIHPGNGELTVSQTDLELPGRNGLDLSLTRVYQSQDANIYRMGTRVEEDTYQYWEPGYWEQDWYYSPEYFYWDWGSYTSSTWDDYWYEDWGSGTYGGSSTKRVKDPDCKCYITLPNWTDPHYEEWYYYYDHWGYDVYWEDYEYSDSYWYTGWSYVKGHWETATDYYPVSARFTDTHTDRRNGLGVGWQWAFPTLELRGSEITYHDGGSAMTVDWKSPSHFKDYSLRDLIIDKDSGTFSNGQTTSKYVVKAKDGKKTYFGSDGRLLGIVDRYGNQITFQHTTWNNNPVISRITDTVGRVVTLAYTANQVTVTAPDGRTWRYNLSSTEGGKLLLSSVSDPAGRTTNYSYTTDSATFNFLSKSNRNVTNYYANLGAITYPTGGSTSFAYQKVVDNLGSSGSREVHKIASRKDTVGGVDVNQVSYSYSGEPGGYPTHSNPNKLPSTYTYTGTMSRADGSTESVAYDNRHLSVRREAHGTGANRIVEEFYDSKKTPTETRISQVDPDGTQVTATTRTTFDDFNNLVSATDAQGAVTTYTYDSKFHQPTSVTVQQNGSGTQSRTEFTVNATNGNMEASRQVYTENGQDKSIWTYYTYDAFGNQIEAKLKRADGTYQSKQFQYDPAYQSAYLTQVTETYTHESGIESQAVTRYGYNFQTGWVTSYTDPMGATTTTEYDVLGRVKAINLPAVGGSTARKLLSYDDTQAISQVTDENGHVTSYHYDQLGRMSSIRRSLNGTPVTIYQVQYDATGNKSAETDANGNTHRFSYDADHRLTGVTFPDLTSSTIAYDDVNRRRTETDGNGNAVVTTLDVMGRPVEQQAKPDKNGSTVYQTAYTYDFAGNKLTERDPNGNVTRYTYDTLNRMVQMVDAGGGEYRFTYDNAGNQLSVAGPDGRTTTKVYDRSNRLLRATDALGNITSYAYDAKGRRIAATDPRSHTTRYEYDARDRITRVTDALGNASSFTYDAIGNRLTTTDPRGHTTTHAYDEWNRLTTTTHPTGAVTQFGYDLNGNQTSQTDPLGNTTRYTYDTRNQVVEEINAAGVKVATHTYDAAGNVISTRDALGGVTSLAYDGLNRLVRRTNPLGVAETLTYDGNSNLTQSVDGKGSTTTFTYNGRNQLITARDAAGSTWNLTYDAYGNVIRITDPLGRTVREDTYDEMDRRTTSRDPLGNVTTFQYDPIGNLVAAQTGNLVPLSESLLSNDPDHNGVATGWGTANWTNTDDTAAVTWSVEGNAQKVTINNHQPGPDGAVYDYSAAITRTGSASRLAAAPGQVYSMSVDSLQTGGAFAQLAVFYLDAQNNRLATQYGPAFANRQQWGRNAFTTDPAPAGTAALEMMVIFRTNGSNGPDSQNGSAWFRHLQIERGESATAGPRTFTYDALNRRTSMSAAGGVDASFAYDSAGNRSSMTDSTGTTTYTYDALNRITRKQVPDGKQIGYEYDAAGNLTRLTDYGGKVTQYTYTTTGRLEAASFDGGAPVRLTYNAAGRRSQLQLPNGWTTGYEYDAAQRLTGQSITSGANLLDQFTYGYDAANNVTSKTESGITTSYTYDAIYRLLTEQSSRGTTEYAYDPVGNRTRKTDSLGTTTYAYDAANRLTQEAGPSGTFGYTYDTSGNQLSDGRNQYTYDGLDRLVEVEGGQSTVTYQYDGDGLMTARSVGDATRRFYLNGQRVINEGDGAGNVLAAMFDVAGMTVGRQVGSEAPAYFLHNGHGDTVGLVDSAGVRVASYEYDAFGQLTNRTGNSDNPYLYAGEYYDFTTEQYYLRARFYNPAAGRFLTQDSYLGAYNDPQSLHLYAYVKNNPLIYVDPSGHNPVRFEYENGYSDYNVKSYWQHMAWARIDHPNDPVLRNREITAQYAKLYLSNPDVYKWAGAGAYVSKTVGDLMAMMDDFAAVYGADAKWGWMRGPEYGSGSGTSAAIAAMSEQLRDTLAEGNRLIFNDIFWQHLAYDSGGLAELEKAHEQGDLSDQLMETWRTIDQGRKLLESDDESKWAEGQALIWQGAQGLAWHEQKIAIAPIYQDEKMRSTWNLISSVLYSPIPDNPNPMFRSHVPGANIADTDARWKWTSESLLPHWQTRDTYFRSVVIDNMTALAGQRIAKPTTRLIWRNGHFEVRSSDR